SRRQASRHGERGARNRNACRLGAEEMQPGAQRMGHHEVGARGGRLIDRGDRVGGKEAELAHRRLVVGPAAGGGPGKDVAAAVAKHGFLELLVAQGPLGCCPACFGSSRLAAWSSSLGRMPCAASCEWLGRPHSSPRRRGPRGHGCWPASAGTNGKN